MVHADVWDLSHPCTLNEHYATLFISRNRGERFVKFISCRDNYRTDTQCAYVITKKGVTPV